MELGFVRSAYLSIKFACRVRCLDFAARKQFFVFGNCRKQRITGNGKVSIVRFVDVEAGLMFNERHDRTVGLMYVDGWLLRGIHRDAAYLTDLGERQNVRDGLSVVPYFAEVRVFADHG